MSDPHTIGARWLEIDGHLCVYYEPHAQWYVYHTNPWLRRLLPECPARVALWVALKLCPTL